jgi:hypothetical protein
MELHAFPLRFGSGRASGTALVVQGLIVLPGAWGPSTPCDIVCRCLLQADA